MARRRRSTRRRSLRSFGAVLVNAGGPRRRRKRKNPPQSGSAAFKRSVKGRTAKGTRSARKAWRKKYSTTVSKYTRKGRTVRAHARRKGKKGTRRKVHAWNYKKGRMRLSRKGRALRRRRKARRNPAPKVVRRRKARSSVRSVVRRRRKSHKSARRNPAIVSGLQRQLKKIPVLGKHVLAPAVGLIPHAAVGAVGAVETAFMLQNTAAFKESAVGQFFADKPHLFYAASGITAALLAQLLPAKLISDSEKGKLQAALAASGFGAGYLLWRQSGGSLLGAVTLGQLSAGYAPVGALAMSGPGGYGEGPAYTVSPLGSPMGAVVLG
jgi:hypothetical protein